MRKSQLRQYADRYLNQNNQGSPRDRKYRYFVIHKMIDDLFRIKEVPPKWYVLNKLHLEKLIYFWKKKKIKQTTIMKYMTVIRWFLKLIDHPITGIKNKDLGLSKKQNSKKPTSISPDIFQKISDPITKTILDLQIHFGLTFSEAIRLIPDVHLQPNIIWLTREIASNSQDRIIPIRSDEQNVILKQLISLIGINNTLISSHGYDAIRYAYRKNLESLRLPVRKYYRYLYAQMLYAELSPILRNYELILLIMREMGLQSRVTLWGYLRE